MKRLFGRRIVDRERQAGPDSPRIVHLPEDLRNPTRVAVYCGPTEEDAWPALYLARAVELAYRKAELTVICRSDVGWLFDALHWKPRILPYESRPSLEGRGASPVFDEGTILFHPYPAMDPAAAALFASSGAGLRVSAAVDCPDCVNILVRPGTPVLPDRIHGMCAVLGMQPDRAWRPVVPGQVQEKASARMAPVSGRTLPYIAGTPRTVSLLEKHRAEIPLRTITIAGRNSEMGEMDRETRVAAAAGASAIITDSPVLWADARAMGVPVVGLDPAGVFQPWIGEAPTRTEKEFVEAWERLLRKGW